MYNKSIGFAGRITFREETNLGKTLVLRYEGIHVILSELPMLARYPYEFKDLELKIMKADIVVVKNLFPFRYLFLAYNRKTVNVITPGLSNIRVSELKYQHLPRPIYPLDDLESWRK